MQAEGTEEPEGLTPVALAEGISLYNYLRRAHNRSQLEVHPCIRLTKEAASRGVTP